MKDFQHADFWVAVATVASALLIANAVLAAQLLRSKSTSWVTWTAYGASAVAMLCSAYALPASLLALDQQRDRGWGLDMGAIVELTIAVVATFAAALFAGSTRP